MPVAGAIIPKSIFLFGSVITLRLAGFMSLVNMILFFYLRNNFLLFLNVILIGIIY